jgi:hypothetical protein
MTFNFSALDEVLDLTSECLCHGKAAEASDGHSIMRFICNHAEREVDARPHSLQEEQQCAEAVSLLPLFLRLVAFHSPYHHILIVHTIPRSIFHDTQYFKIKRRWRAQDTLQRHSQFLNYKAQEEAAVAIPT